MSNNIEQTYQHQRPVVKGLIIGIALLVISHVLLVFFMPTAWAVMEIPVTDHITISTGTLLDWGQFLLAVAGFWMVYKKAAGAEKASLKAVQQSDGIIEKIAALAKKEGQAEEKLVGEATAATLAKGREEGRRDSIQASAEATMPLPVSDDRTANAAEDSASALGRMTDATEKRGGIKK